MEGIIAERVASLKKEIETKIWNYLWQVLDLKCKWIYNVIVWTLFMPKIYIFFKEKQIMKVLLINGSPNVNGSTATALNEVATALNEEGIETIWSFAESRKFKPYSLKNIVYFFIVCINF